MTFQYPSCPHYSRIAMQERERNSLTFDSNSGEVLPCGQISKQSSVDAFVPVKIVLNDSVDMQETSQGFSIHYSITA